MYEDNQTSQGFDYSDPYKPLTVTTEQPKQTKADYLANKREQKRQRITAVAGFSDTDLNPNISIRTEDGYQDNMGNKVLNDLSVQELNYFADTANSEYGYTRTEQGFVNNATGQVTQQAPVGYGSLYMFHGKPYLDEAGNETRDLKIGTWGGLDPRDRFSAETLAAYGTNTGTRGVDSSELIKEYILPVHMVDLLEGYFHGNQNMLNKRKVRFNANQAEADPSYYNRHENLKASYGSGYSEFYSPDALTTEPTLNQEELVQSWLDFSNKHRLSTGGAETAEEYGARIEAERRENKLSEGVGFINRGTNAVSALASSFVLEFLVNPTDWALKSIFRTDGFGTEEEKNAYIYDLFGYDDTFVQAATEAIKKSVSNIYDAFAEGKALDWGDVGNIIKLGITNPEYLMQSLGAIAALTIGFGKATKVGSQISAVEKAYKAGELGTGAAAKALAKKQVRDIKRTATLGENLRYLAADNVGFGVTVLGQTQNNIEQFKENNNGQIDESQALNVFLFSTAAAATDRLSAEALLGNLLPSNAMNRFSKAITGVASEVPAQMRTGLFSNVQKLVVNSTKTALELGGGAALEGVQEMTQELLTMFATDFGSEKYGSDLSDFMTGRDRHIDILTAGALGAIQGGQMRGINVAAGKVGDALSFVGDDALRKRTKTLQEEDELSEQAREEQERKDTFDNDSATLSAALARLVHHADTELTNDNVSDMLDALINVRRTQYSAAGQVIESDVAHRADEAERRIVELFKGSVDGDVKLSDMLERLKPNTESLTQALGEVTASVDNLTTAVSTGEAAIVTAEEKQLAIVAKLDALAKEAANDNTTDERKGIIAGEVQKLNTQAETVTNIHDSTVEELVKFKDELFIQEKRKERLEEQLANVEGKMSVHQKKALAEIALRMVVEGVTEDKVPDENGLITFTPEEHKKFESFASLNGLGKPSVDSLVKNYETVRFEAWDDFRGINHYKENLLYEIASADPSRFKLRKDYSSVASFLETTEESTAALEEGVKRAIEEADKLNKQAAANSSGGRVSITTNYKKHIMSEGGNKLFDITVAQSPTAQSKNKHGTHQKWVPHVKEAKKLIAEKKKTADGLTTLLGDFHVLASRYLDSSKLVSDGGYFVPEKGSATKTKKGQKEKDMVAQEHKYIKKLVNRIQDVFNNSARINKVILGDRTAKHWQGDKTGLRYRQNIGLVNNLTTRNSEYSENDVVLVNALGLFGKGKTKSSELLNKATDGNKELFAAMKAGATIVLAMDNNAGTKEGRAITAVLHKYGYITLGSTSKENKNKSSDSNIFVPATEANKTRLEKSKLDVEATKKAEAKEASDKGKLRTSYYQLLDIRNQIKDKENEISRANSAGEDVTALTESLDKLKERETKVEETHKELREQVGQEYFTKKAVAAAKARADKLIAEQKLNELIQEHNDELVEAEGLEVGEAVNDDEIIASESEMLDLMATVSDSIEKNIDTYLQGALVKQLEAYRLDDEAGIDIGKGVLANLYVRQSRAEAKKTENISNFLLEWADITAKKLSGKALLTAVTDLASRYGLTEDITIGREAIFNPADAATRIINTSLGKLVKENLKNPENNPDGLIYRITVEVTKNGKTSIEYRTRYSKASMNSHVANIINGKYNNKGSEDTSPTTYRVLSVSTYDTDVSTVVSTKTAPTVVNSLPVSGLPLVFRNIAATIHKSLNAVVPKPTEVERTMTNTGDNTVDRARFNIVDSPARALIFSDLGEDGGSSAIDETFALAVGIALRNSLDKDRGSLLIGPKSREQVANQFSTPTPDMVTPEMLKIASENGMLRKTLADTLGRDILSILGISEVDGAQHGAFQRLVSDIGVMAIAAGIHEGLLVETEVSSNELAKAYPDGQITDNDSVKTTFVNMTSQPNTDTTTGFTRNEPSKAAAAAIIQITGIADTKGVESYVPDIAGRRKEPFFGSKPSDPENAAYYNKALNTTRNDMVGSKPNAAQQEALKNFMDTEYELNMVEAGKLLAAYDNENTRDGLLASLGYIIESETNPAYQVLPYDQKIIQTEKNKNIIRSVEYVREFHDRVVVGESQGQDLNSLYFGYFYSGNQRYNIDSNTINVQADKLHRFLFVPKASDTSYEFDASNNTFTKTLKFKDGSMKTIESSLYIRAALAQAFGKGIDKEATYDIIDVGNAILSMSEAMIDKVEAALTSGGEAVLSFVNRKGEDEKLKLKPDHLTHGLQALNFLRLYNEAKNSGNTSVQAALLVEADALTSGSHNKAAQMGMFQDLTKEFRKLGILDTRNDTNMEGHYGMNDYLSSGEFFDSYQDAGVDVIYVLSDVVDGLSDSNSLATITDDDGKKVRVSSFELFHLLEPLLPNATERGTHLTAVSKGLRDLMKAPFMTFNYAASLKSIKERTANKLANDIVNGIAALDMTKTYEKGSKEHATIQAAKVLAAKITEHRKLPKPMTVQELQTELRTKPMTKLMVSHVYKSNEKTIKKTLTPTEYLAETLLLPTYGAAIQRSFSEKYEDYLSAQDTVNDTFKMAFGVFNTAFNEELAELRKPTITVDNEGNETVSFKAELADADIKSIVQKLHHVFPAVAGPMTEDGDAGSSDVHVYDSDVKSESDYTRTGSAPQTLLQGKDGQYKTKVNPLIKQIVAAVSAGSVLPIQAVDGAQMTVTNNVLVRDVLSQIEGMDYDGTGMIPVHDALVMAAYLMDIVPYTYNKMTMGINRDYDFIGGMVELVERLQKHIKENAKLDINNREVPAGVKTHKQLLDASKTVINGETKPEPTFTEVLDDLQQKLMVIYDKSREAREVYNSETTNEQAMVSFAGSGFTAGKQGKIDRSVTTEEVTDNLDYLDGLTSNYSEYDVSLNITPYKGDKSAPKEKDQFRQEVESIIDERMGNTTAQDEAINKADVFELAEDNFIAFKEDEDPVIEEGTLPELDEEAFQVLGKEISKDDYSLTVADSSSAVLSKDTNIIVREAGTTTFFVKMTSSSAINNTLIDKAARLVAQGAILAMPLYARDDIDGVTNKHGQDELYQAFIAAGARIHEVDSLSARVDKRLLIVYRGDVTAASIPTKPSGTNAGASDTESILAAFTGNLVSQPTEDVSQTKEDTTAIDINTILERFGLTSEDPDSSLESVEEDAVMNKKACDDNMK